MMRSVTVVLAGLLLLGCSDSQGPTRNEAEGAWQGTLHGSQLDALRTLTLIETNGSVTGNGSVAGPGGSNALTVPGTYSPPHLSLTLATPGFEDMNLTATVGETDLTGTVNGPVFSMPA